MQHFTFVALASTLFGVLSISCGGGDGDAEGGGLVGFSTGTPQSGPVPSDGTSAAAPAVTGVVVTNNPAKNGDPLHVNVSFSDSQGDVATVNVGIAGQASHSVIAVAGIGLQTSGTLFIDLKPASNSSGTYTLVVSITDAAGHSSVAVSVPFTILNPDGTLPSGGVDAGSPLPSPDAAHRLDVAFPAGDVGGGLPDGGLEVGKPDLVASPDMTVRDVAVLSDLPGADIAPGDVPCIPGAVVNSTTAGGLWHATTTWVCGVIPTAADDVQINGEVQVDLSAAQAVATCRNLTVVSGAALRGAYQSKAKIQVMGNLMNLGAVRNGPDYASTDGATLDVYVGGNLSQYNAYAPASTHFTGATTQIVTYAGGAKMAGSFVDDNPASGLQVGGEITAEGTTLTLGTVESGSALFDMGDFQLTLAAGDFKVVNGALRASKIVGLAGATLSAGRIVASTGTLTLEGDIRTATTSITGSVVVAPSSAFYNQSNTDAVVTISGSLTNNGIVRQGPGYAAYNAGTMTIDLGGDLAQNGDYTVTATSFQGTVAQTITLLAGKTLTGKFIDTTGASPLQAGSDLNITNAEFLFPGGETSPGALRMGSYKITHPSGDLAIATGVLEAGDLTGDTDGNAPFSVANITPPSGTLTVRNHFRTGNLKVTGNLTLAAGARMYNQLDVLAYVTVTGAVTSDPTAIMGSGPGYASYDDGALYLNGDRLVNW
ncbi:MAG: hypothetical protein JXP73_01220 [Deltaproteobacteria bacterium]|nr:hypothetical protein [Deltaproteobacteria bacterium]